MINICGGTKLRENYSVLIVEDEALQAKSVARKIESIGLNFKIVQTVSNGEEALAFISKHPVDVLFTDILMPIMDGIELLGIVASKFPLVQVVVISGQKDFNYFRKAMLLGAKAYLLKPVSEEELSDLLKRLEVDLAAAKAMRERVRAN
jgi:two-component system response regulator YesN